LIKTKARLSSQVVNLVVRIFLFLLPECEVFLEELNDALGVSEVIFLELIDFVKGFLESLVSKVACGLVILHYFVVED